jgi:hypothetical protein
VTKLASEEGKERRVNPQVRNGLIVNRISKQR